LELDSTNFIDVFLKNNRNIYRLLSDTDIIVVNGEGTLHNTIKSSMNLLFLTYISKVYLKKNVYLINHSCYPGGSTTPSPSDFLYKKVYSVLDLVVSREIISSEIIEKHLKVPFVQGFDCLPLFIDKYFNEDQQKKNDFILISGGVAFPKEKYKLVFDTILKTSKTFKIKFLFGAKSHIAYEDIKLAKYIKEYFPEIEIVCAPSINEWLNQIKKSQCLISGRFHCSVAAAFLKVPFISFPSNTPKIKALCQMVKMDLPIEWDDKDFKKKLTTEIKKNLSGKGKTITEKTKQKILKLAENNFIFLS
jgi:polysaccharide pyruvyl transferase WcaK-like protein